MVVGRLGIVFFFSSRRRHTRLQGDWSSDVCSSDLFDQKLLADLFTRLKPLVTDKCPFAERPKPDRGMTWVKPQLVCQVKFTHWTQDGRLRAPVFLGLRNDVPAPEVSRERSGELLPASAKEATLTVDGRS